MFGLILPVTAGLAATVAAQSSSVVSATLVQPPTDPVIVTGPASLPILQHGHHAVGPRDLAPRLVDYHVDINALPVKTHVNVDGEDITIYSANQELVDKVVPILKDYFCGHPQYAALFPILCRINHGAGTVPGGTPPPNLLPPPPAPPTSGSPGAPLAPLAPPAATSPPVLPISPAPVPPAPPVLPISPAPIPPKPPVLPISPAPVKPAPPVLPTSSLPVPPAPPAWPAPPALPAPPAIPGGAQPPIYGPQPQGHGQTTTPCTTATRLSTLTRQGRPGLLDVPYSSGGKTSTSTRGGRLLDRPASAHDEPGKGQGQTTTPCTTVTKLSTLTRPGRPGVLETPSHTAGLGQHHVPHSSGARTSTLTRGGRLDWSGSAHDGSGKGQGHGFHHAAPSNASISTHEGSQGYGFHRTAFSNGSKTTHEGSKGHGFHNSATSNPFTSTRENGWWTTARRPPTPKKSYHRAPYPTKVGNSTSTRWKATGAWRVYPSSRKSLNKITRTFKHRTGLVTSTIVSNAPQSSSNVSHTNSHTRGYGQHRSWTRKPQHGHGSNRTATGKISSTLASSLAPPAAHDSKTTAVRSSARFSPTGGFRKLSTASRKSSRSDSVSSSGHKAQTSTEIGHSSRSRSEIPISTPVLGGGTTSTRTHRQAPISTWSRRTWTWAHLENSSTATSKMTETLPQLDQTIVSTTETNRPVLSKPVKNTPTSRKGFVFITHTPNGAANSTASWPVPSSVPSSTAPDTSPSSTSPEPMWSRNTNTESTYATNSGTSSTSVDTQSFASSHKPVRTSTVTKVANSALSSSSSSALESQSTTSGSSSTALKSRPTGIGFTFGRSSNPASPSHTSDTQTSNVWRSFTLEETPTWRTLPPRSSSTQPSTPGSGLPGSGQPDNVGLDGEGPGSDVPESDEPESEAPGSDASADVAPGNGGTGSGGREEHGGAVRTTPKWPKQLTGTVTVWPYPSVTAIVRRTPPSEAMFDEPMTGSLGWDTFGVTAEPYHTAEKLPESTTIPDPPLPTNAQQKSERQQMIDAQEWIKGILDRAEAEFKKTMTSLTAAIGIVNGLLGWNRA